ncbi:MAG: TIR domain-containing protein [Clostridia bacterium]|nr:TIR domain-containing protein [Clostridia bacterium]
MKKIEVIRCSSCGSSAVENIGNNIGKCKHCGSTMLLPRQNEEIVSLLNAAYVYRENFNYDLAIKSYQFVLEKDSNELSAYEGILLSKYGIEYVKDSYTGKLIPTCHRAHFKSIFEDDYYKTLTMLANDQQKQVIEAKAKEIDVLQKAIERQLQNEQEYDVFISYKATDKNGEKTEDSVIAREIYEELTKKNYRVFLAEKSLENRIGSEYEPIIFKALHTSSVFILVGTSKENVEANWVRNEWSRFIDRIKNNEDLPSGCFIPVFKGMNPYDMPKINNTFVQGVDASKLGYAITIVDGVSKMLKPEEDKKIIDVLDNVENFSEFENLQKRKKLELKKKHWEELKKSKGPKKYAYFAFLYSPYLLGILTLTFSLLIGTMFLTRPEFVIFIILFIALLTMTIITYKTQLKKYVLKPLIHIVIPFTILAISFATYFIRLCLIPIGTIDKRPPIYNLCGNKYSNGIVYDTYTDYLTQKTDVHLYDILDFRKNDFIKTHNGKRTFFVPDTIKGQKITSGYLAFYEDIDVMVIPKDLHSLDITFFEKPTKTIEIYSYNPSDIHFQLRIKDSYYPFEPDDFKYIKFYYEENSNRNNWSDSDYLENYGNLIQQEIEFYH